jgi:hypothetical protein
MGYPFVVLRPVALCDQEAAAGWGQRGSRLA